MFGRTVAPALAMGNATVIKRRKRPCMVPLRLAELAAEAGFPDGAINVVPGLGEEAGAALSPTIAALISSRSRAARKVGTLIPDRSGEEPYRLHARTRRQIPADHLRRCRSRSRRAIRGGRNRAECRADLLGGQPSSGGTAHLGQVHGGSENPLRADPRGHAGDGS